MAWTSEQIKAIEEEGTNIIVSAGAGSGKTAVLTTRVLEKVKKKIHINELLILTFTNAAAAEMKERIKKNLIDENLTDEINKLDKAYITTFDSFALSLVKKYHYLLNIPKNVTITDSSILNTQKRKILNEIFEEYYKENNNEKFKNLIYTLCTKDDEELQSTLLNLANKLEIRIDLEEYLENYLEFFYNNEKIKEIIRDYQTILKEKIAELFTTIDQERNNFESDYLSKILESLSPLKETEDLDSLLAKIEVSKLPILPRGSEEETKNAKEKINATLKELKELTIYGNTDTIKSDYVKSKELIEIILEIFQKYFQRLTKYKMQNFIFDFQDIAHLSLKLVKENSTIRESLKNEFKEIMVDEYQDTSDTQEAFISLISNNNVYMVGDIKQSIYRFRNANPHIFRDKYNSYSKGLNGKKIDLLKNFRSRKEVLENINTIFNPVMDEDIGNADYITSHQMVFGNLSYEEKGASNTPHEMDILTYNPKESEFSKEEIEIFTIGQDIINKIKNSYPVFNMKTGELKGAEYKDFCIIMDRNTTFDLTKKIFEYLKIPLALYKDEELNTSTDIYLIKNILTFLIQIKERNFTETFRHAFISIARSYLYRLPDDEIFTYFTNFTFKESEIFKDLAPISKEIDSKSISEILEEVILKTNLYEKLITVGNMKETTIRIDKIMELSNNYNQLGYTIYEFVNFLEELLTKDEKIKYNLGTSSSNSVKIMNIHKSKGLEFPICYFCGLYKSFSKKDLTSLIIYEKDSPIYIPIFNDGLKENVTKLLIKEKMKKEDISEKIRLFYVALTRAKEKMVFLLPENNTSYEQKNENGIISNSIRYKYKSFADIFYSIPNEISKYIKKIDTNNLNLTKDYLIPQELKLDISSSNAKINVNPINIKENMIESVTFSKKIPKFIDKETKKNMDLGIKVHEIFEYIDFKNFDANLIDDPWLCSLIENLLNQPLLKNRKDATIYQEYEFIYQKENKEYHGIIDLMLIYKDHIDIIDYKLNDITDEAYIDQLKGYKEYIEQEQKLPVHTYLFSILTKTIKEII